MLAWDTSDTKRSEIVCFPKQDPFKLIFKVKIFILFFILNSVVGILEPEPAVLTRGDGGHPQPI